MRDFVCGGDRSIFRFVRFHVAMFVCTLWQHVVMTVMSAEFMLRLLFWPQRRHRDSLLRHIKVRVQRFCAEYALVDMKIRGSYTSKAAMSPMPPSAAALEAHQGATSLYFMAWKPFLLGMYVLPIILACTHLPFVDDTGVLAGVAVGLVVYLALVAFLHDWVCEATLVPLFRHVEEDDANADTTVVTPSYPGPSADTNYTRLPSATDVVDRELYCIPVPAPPFVSSCADLTFGQSMPASLTNVSRESSNDSVIRKPPRHLTPRALEVIDQRALAGSVPRRASPPPVDSTPYGLEARHMSARSTSRSSHDTPPPSYASLPMDRSQDSATSESKPPRVRPGSDVSLTEADEVDSIVQLDARKKVTVLTNVMHEYDSFEFDQDGGGHVSGPAGGVYRSVPDPDHVATTTSQPWLSPTNYAGFAPSAPDYGILSPTVRTAAPRHPRPFEPSAQVFRSVSDPTKSAKKQDSVHFLAYAPPTVSVDSTFPFTIWAFLVHQRQDMHERAVADEVGSRQLSREVLMPLRRGALAHVHLEVPDGFVVQDGPTKAFTWTGDVTNVKYSVRCIFGAHVHAQVLFKATIVVGADVMVLRSYVFVTTARVDATGEAMMEELTCELELLPKTFDEIPYDLLNFKELIGEGHFGDAYRAEYKGKNVVVKTLKAQDLGGPTDQSIEEFRHEAAVLNMFGHHPNIVPFVGASTDVSRPLTLVTEYLPQGSLESQLTTRQLSVNQKEVILGDASAGVLNIHEGGFVHRDIAARNCLVDDALRTKICDFGMCRRVNGLVGGSYVSNGVGPLKYMAPESLVPPHTFSYGSDVYSFGVLMWETFAETGPFADLSGAAAAAYVLEGGRLDLHRAGRTIIPDKYHSLMASCFAEDPSKRPTMAEVHQFLR